MGADSSLWFSGQAEDFKASCNWHFGPEGTPGRGPSALSDSENDDGAFGSPAAAQGTKCVARRKHHRLWTLAEVMKLIEGVSRYGVGRWTKIKRLLFSSSGHRTSVDLKVCFSRGSLPSAIVSDG